MSQGLVMSQSFELSCSLAQFIGEGSGDIPIYSLHRLRRLVKTIPMPVSPELQTMFLRAAIEANTDYRAESGNDWYCLTSSYLVTALETLETRLRDINDIAVSTQAKQLRPLLEKALETARIKCIHSIRDWFETNYESLLYRTDGSVPWPVVMRLRKDLRAWSWGATDPFGQSIGDMVMEVAEEQGLRCEDPESAWKAMGGKIKEKPQAE